MQRAAVVRKSVSSYSENKIVSEKKPATENDARWGRRDFLRLSAQVTGAVMSQLASPIPSWGSEAGASTAARMGHPKKGLVLTADTPWIVSDKEPEPLQRALEDVQRDWYKVFGHVPVIVSSVPTSWEGSAIYFGLDIPGSKDRAAIPTAGRESFSLDVQSIDGRIKAVVATGADLRGAIYAAYAFSEHILGVDPWWYWADKEPSPRGAIDVSTDFSQRVGSPTFKYRGWFINDEDLLSGFSPDPLRENVFSLEMLDCICETLLRLRGNMLVPATFAFPDERCHELVARRGLALNMHHADVVGLNVMRWPADVPFSYSKHPEIMERYWQECIDALKDKEVVWTVGYRGKGDQPFWEDDPELTTEQARGDVITRAIAKQVELIRQVQPKAPITTSMWYEGAKLYIDGFIKIPSGVTLVWTDDGAGFMRDAGKVGARDGMYYHTMMLDGKANQLSEFVPPERICHEMGRFIRASATEFFLVNVSDVRPVPLSTECAMTVAWDARPYLSRSDKDNQAAFLLDWTRRQFGPEAALMVADLYQEYFAIPGRQPKVSAWEAIDASPRTDKGSTTENSGTVPRGDNAPHAYLRSLSDVALPLMQNGRPLSGEMLKQVGEYRKFAATNRGYFLPLLGKAKTLAGKIPANRQDFYESHVLTAFGINLHSNEMLEYYCRALQTWAASDRAGAIAYFERALRAVDTLFAALRPAERGKWAGWYRGEGLVGLEHSRDLIRQSQAAARGEPLPPVRTSHNYSQFYQYQERFRQNFPRLYRPQK